VVDKQELIELARGHEEMKEKAIKQELINGVMEFQTKQRKKNKPQIRGMPSQVNNSDIIHTTSNNSRKNTKNKKRKSPPTEAETTVNEEDQALILADEAGSNVERTFSEAELAEKSTQELENLFFEMSGVSIHDIRHKYEDIVDCYKRADGGYNFKIKWQDDFWNE
jgi:hypothetical protein